MITITIPRRRSTESILPRAGFAGSGSTGPAPCGTALASTLVLGLESGIGKFLFSEESRGARSVPHSGRRIRARSWRGHDACRYQTKGDVMPEKETLERATEDKREGKSPSTQAGEFVREEIEHIREGKHGARSTKQAIAIGLSKARRAGVKLPPPKAGQASTETREQAKRDVSRGRSTASASPSRKRSRATLRALKREGRAAVSRKALARQARTAARRRRAA